MPPAKSLSDLREIYTELAPFMDRFEWVDRLLFGRHRRRLFQTARGQVLDVACGLGTNLDYLPKDVEYLGADLSPDMLERARVRYGDDPRVRAFSQMDAARLALPDGAFDTVISSLSTCTFPAPDRSLREMARVCRPDGRILLLEHGRSSVEILGRLQDWRAASHFEKHGCRWTQDPGEVVARAGLEVRQHERALLGIASRIEAGPAR